MNIITTQVPIWLSILFTITFFFIPPILIANAVKKSFDQAGLASGNKIKKIVLTFYWSYFVIIAILSLTGLFAVNTLPPRIIVIAVIPLFLFYFFVIQKKDWFKIVINNIKLEQLIFIHVFRFVGIFFFLVSYYGSLPQIFADIGGFGDIITATLVLPVIYALKKDANHAKTFAWIWNSIGIIDILSVLTSAIYLTRKAIENNSEGVLDFGAFPFSWIPAFAPATIIFLHLLVYKKLTQPSI